MWKTVLESAMLLVACASVAYADIRQLPPNVVAGIAALGPNLDRK
jgi:hypothetical protein